ncbi:MAG: chromosomal replication initiator protein DnaA [Oscillospiraceae bacterium]|nr:chromosomal replication initiator protein DnaA [Oscillospiraceae bacterium]
MNSFEEMWEKICDDLKTELDNEVAFEIWIKPLKLVFVDGENVTFTCPKWKIEMINKKYSPIISKLWSKHLGFDVKICLIEETQREETKENNGNSLTDMTTQDFTFDNFIVGGSNNMAFSASKRVANTPGLVAFNPLFIYGNSGLGKTHLLNAIIQKMKENNSTANILYTTSEDFTNELIICIDSKNTDAFHNKYRNCDALLIDDIQFIAGKERTEEEFFHTFNTLVKDGKQIVLTSDKKPNEIPKIEERLRTRFESGLICDIQPPDFETRVAIVKNKAEYFNLEMPSDVSFFIAENIKSNIRQLGSAVKGIYAYCDINGIKTPTVEIAKEALKDILITSLPVSVINENIIEKVAETFGVTEEQIKSEKRDSNINEARQVAMYVIHEITGQSQQAIGAIFGRNHSTVNNSFKNVQKKISADIKYKNLIGDIIKNVNG